jgi:xanthine/CO dehydrogenase XdhC/CoxF family maturation factor
VTATTKKKTTALYTHLAPDPTDFRGFFFIVFTSLKVMQDIEDILVVAAAWHEAGERVAIATVTETWGSSPRPVGSRMAMTSSGRIAGSVSGGCIESEVMAAADDVLSSGKPVWLDFGVSNDKAWSVGLSCGGTVKVLVEALK